jgi:TRAP-type C4-dicarboxylate transport system permease small subunit
MKRIPACLKDSLNYLQKGIFSASRIGAIIAIGFLVLLVILTVADVILRRFFNAPIAGAFELSRLILGIIVFFTLAYCAVHGGHIVVDVFVSRFSRRAQSSISIFIHLCSVGIMGVISWQLFLHAMRVQGMGEVTAIWEIWISPFVFLAALGSTLLTIVFLVQLFHAVSEVGRQ